MGLFPPISSHIVRKKGANLNGFVWFLLPHFELAVPLSIGLLSRRCGRSARTRRDRRGGFAHSLHLTQNLGGPSCGHTASSASALACSSPGARASRCPGFAPKAKRRSSIWLRTSSGEPNPELRSNAAAPPLALLPLRRPDRPAVPRVEFPGPPSAACRPPPNGESGATSPTRPRPSRPLRRRQRRCPAERWREGRIQPVELAGVFASRPELALSFLGAQSARHAIQGYAALAGRRPGPGRLQGIAPVGSDTRRNAFRSWSAERVDSGQIAQRGAPLTAAWMSQSIL